jgi:lysozyme family protein
MSFNTEIDKILNLEGGYSNDPLDSGRETNWGITVRTARAYGYTGSMKTMTRDQAKKIYREAYWNEMSLDDIYLLGPNVAAEMFDTGVNQGILQAGKYLQKCLNAFNNGGTLYDDVPETGRVGPLTLSAFSSYIGKRGEEGSRVLCAALNVLQGAFYLDLAARRAKDERFVYGWILNRVLG